MKQNEDMRLMDFAKMIRDGEDVQREMTRQVRIVQAATVFFGAVVGVLVCAFLWWLVPIDRMPGSSCEAAAVMSSDPHLYWQTFCEEAQ